MSHSNADLYGNIDKIAILLCCMIGTLMLRMRQIRGAGRMP
jgi:hypothetical protein